MSQNTKAHVTIFQAPMAILNEKNMYWEMMGETGTFHRPVPARYYLVAFNGLIECPVELPEGQKSQAHAILEHVFYIFNDKHPTGYCGRSLSVGDVVKLEDRYYLCMALGFQEVEFNDSDQSPIEAGGSDVGDGQNLPDRGDSGSMKGIRTNA